MKIKIVLLTVCLPAFGSIAFAQTKKAKNKTIIVAPDVIIKNLYAAGKTVANPFSQTKSRAAIDVFFNKSLADLIWKDLTASKDEVGALDFDPLYYAQETKITAFKIGASEYGKDNSKRAAVFVDFKNFDKAQKIMFALEMLDGKTWKISDISYIAESPGDALTLTQILSGGAARVKRQ